MYRHTDDNHFSMSHRKEKNDKNVVLLNISPLRSAVGERPEVHDHFWSLYYYYLKIPLLCMGESDKAPTSKICRRAPLA